LAIKFQILKAKAPAATTGVYGFAVLNCYGSSSNSDGLYAFTAQNCYGTSGSGPGFSPSTRRTVTA